MTLVEITIFYAVTFALKFETVWKRLFGKNGDPPKVHEPLFPKKLDREGTSSSHEHIDRYL